MCIIVKARPRVHGSRDRLTEAFVAAGLTAREQQVILARLEGRSFAQIGGQISRQRAHQIEASARRKLGLAGSVEAVVLTDDRADRAAIYRDRGRRVRPCELSHDPDAVRPVRQRPDPRELAHERAVEAFLAGCN